MGCGEEMMNTDEVQKILEAQLSGCDISVAGDGSHFQITVVGDVFEGLRPIQRQQLVYRVLNKYIADGDIHAVNMITLARSEANEAN